MAPVAGDFEIIYRSDVAPSSIRLPSGSGRPLDVPRGSNGPRVSIELDPSELGGDPRSGPSENGEEGLSWPGVPKPLAWGARSASAGAGAEGTPAGHGGLESRQRSQVSNSLKPSIAAERRTQGFKIGDMVWGKVKSHPWWPGQVYNEAFAEPHVLLSKVEGYVLVAFFGDSTFGWFDPVGDELISFEPNFAEKSKQSKVGDFLKAVNESVDEVSRRGALTICCSCRTKFNPTDVEGYVEVDVAGYEEGGKYPMQLIMELRSSFKPAKLLSFVRKLALMPQETKPKTLDYVKSKATLDALRRKVFQERDAPYAEAFGYTEKQLCEMALSAEDQLYGSATQDGGKDSVRKVKQSKLLLKRKEEVATSGQPKSRHPLRLVPPHPHQPVTEKPSASGRPDGGKPPDSEKPKLKLRVKHKQPDAGVPVGQKFVHGMVKKVQVPKAPPAEDVKVEYTRKIKKKVLSRDIEDEEHLKKAQTLKRQMDGLIEESSQSLMKKKKKAAMHEAVTDRPQHLEKYTEKSMDIKHLCAEEAPLPIPKLEKGSISETSTDPTPEDEEQLTKSVGKSLSIKSIPAEEVKLEVSVKDAAAVQATYISPNFDPPSMPEPPSLDLPQLVSNLLALATDAFHGADAGVLAAVSKPILKYRSLVFKMSLPSAEEMSFPMPLISSAPEVEEEKKDPAPINPDPALKLERSKRERSERLGELSVKKAKRVEMVREHLSEKRKAVLAEKQHPERAVSEDPVDMGSAPIPSKNQLGPINPAEQQEQPQQKAPSPTFLVMKFPAGARLPSAPLLKAKFARFGPLCADATRIYGNSSTCKVLFKQWPDAMKAYNSVRSRDFFGPQVKVLYSIKDAPSVAPAPAPARLQGILNGKKKAEASDDDARKKLTARRPSSLPQLEPKSCLRKPENAWGSSVKAGPRVRFADGGGVRGRPPPKSVFIDGRSGWTSSVVASPVGATGKLSTWGAAHLASPVPATVTLHPPGRLQPPPPPPPVAAGRRLMDPRHDRSGMELDGSEGGVAPTRVDISGEFLSLLTRCREIVLMVKSLPGFRPYHQL